MKAYRQAIAGLAAMAAVGMGGVAHAQDKCLTPAEAEDLIVFILPTMIDGMARKCGPTLPASAALTMQGAAMAARYRPESNIGWPGAKAAFTKISGEKVPGLLSDEVLKSVIAEASTGAIVQDFKAKDCVMIDRFIGALAPLPARNMGSLVALLMEVGTAEKPNSPVRICGAKAG